MPFFYQGGLNVKIAPSSLQGGKCLKKICTQHTIAFNISEKQKLLDGEGAAWAVVLAGIFNRENPFDDGASSQNKNGDLPCI